MVMYDIPRKREGGIRGFLRVEPRGQRGKEGGLIRGQLGPS